MGTSDQSGKKASLTSFGLYYPYIHFRDESWLKMAALYWPRMARVVPPGYQTRDSDLVKRLDGELGFVVNVDPSMARASTAARFANLMKKANTSVIDQLRIRRNILDLGESLYGFHRGGPSVSAGEAMGAFDPEDIKPPTPLLLADYSSGDEFSPDLPPGVPFSSGNRSSPGVGPSSGPGFSFGHGFSDIGLAGLHNHELDPGLLKFLRAEELAVEGPEGWWGVSPSLAWVYKCELTEELAERNRLTPATDNWIPHVTSAALSSDLGSDDHETDIGSRFGLMALKAVAPANLESVPIEKIVKVRSKFGAEFDRWRTYVDDVGEFLTNQLATVESPDVVQAYLEEAVRTYSTQPLEDLRRGLRDVGLEAGLAQVSTRFAVPAAIGAVTGVASIAAGIDAAAAIVGSRQLVKTKAREQRTRPTAYLMEVSNVLKQRSLLERMMAAIRYGVGLSG